MDTLKIPLLPERSLSRCAWLRKRDALTMVRYQWNDLNWLGDALLAVIAILAFWLRTEPSPTGPIAIFVGAIFAVSRMTSFSAPGHSRRAWQ